MPRTLFLIPPLLFVAACGPETAGNNSSVDINAAAVQAQGAVDAYSANANADMIEVPEPEAPISNANGAENALAPLDPPAPGTPGGLPDDRTPISEAPFTPDSAQGAANVVQSYYALIEAGKYRQAYALRDDGGTGTAAAFAADFARYSEYHANVGAPGAIDAGAGQRNVTVPVQVYARLKQGGAPAYQIGSVTLHRTEVDGATAEQRRWRIRDITLHAAPKR
ncbi:hypothetical protein AB5I39_14605 [Sphingomonas sp. MMS24-J45]|uniref:hypothetical protein n=1 Tax=Sphingomonas sp. MMS24-J45 TaxID=3238806 RepID=UPI00384C5E65